MYRLKIYTWTKFPGTTAEAPSGNDVFDDCVAVGVDQADGNTLLAELDAGLPGCKCRSLIESVATQYENPRRLNSLLEIKNVNLNIKETVNFKTNRNNLSPAPCL